MEFSDAYVLYRVGSHFHSVFHTVMRTFGLPLYPPLGRLLGAHRSSVSLRICDSRVLGGIAKSPYLSSTSRILCFTVY